VRQWFENIKDGMKKQMADKAMGLACGSGMNMEQNSDVVAGENTSRNKKKVCCGA
jgi:hypothetical protein